MAGKGKGGRPRATIDKNVFEALCSVFCTRDDIARYFGYSYQTVSRWCKDTYGKSFTEVSEKFSTFGVCSLRQAGFRLAKKNPAVHIFYAKNYLGMSDMKEKEADATQGGAMKVEIEFVNGKGKGDADQDK